LLGEAFGAERVLAAAHGDVLASIGFLHGLAVEDLSIEELDANAAEFPLLITGCAVKAGRGRVGGRQDLSVRQRRRRA
jgi:hypothetical protein